MSNELISTMDGHNQKLLANTFLRKLGDAFSRTRLTPFVKSGLAAWLSWGR